MSAFIDLKFFVSNLVNSLPVQRATSGNDIELLDVLNGPLEDRTESVAVRSLSVGRAYAGDSPSFTIRPRVDSSAYSFELLQNKSFREDNEGVKKEDRVDEVLAFRTISFEN